jgi:nucleotide-binding universal stress UspA family protein
MKINPQLTMKRPAMRHRRSPRRAATHTWRPTNILVPTDFSYAADHALNCARQFARIQRARIVLLHVVAPVSGPDLLFTSIRTDLPEMAQLSEQRLGRLARRMKLPPHQQAVRMGSAAEEILRFADEIKAGLIVIGWHGHGALERMLIGGTTLRVVRNASCPVLVVPPAVQPKSVSTSAKKSQRQR